MGISSVDADESSVTGYREISGVAAQDWMLYSQDASKVAVVHTKTAIDSPPKGESIAVYSVDLNLQPAQVLFEDKTEGQVVTEFQWVGNKLLYAVTENNLKPLVDASTSNQQGVVPLGDYPGILKFKMWPESTDRKIGISNIRIFPPGNILSNEANDSLITFDNTQDISALWDPIHRRFFDAIFDQRFLRQYQVSTDTLHERIRLNLPMLPARWWGGRNKFVPLFVSEDGGHLISIVGNNTTLSPNTKPIRSSVVSVNLSDGNIKPLTSGSDANGLHLPQGSDPRFFAPGNPASVSSNQVVCQLSMINTIDAVTSRFGFFDLNGKLLKDVFLFDQDLKKNGIAESVLVTWTQDGTRVLLQDGNIWLYNWHSKEGQKIHKDVWIDDVVGWIDETHLLVRAAPTNEFKSGSKILSEDFVLRNKKWGILVVPAAKNYDE